MPASRVVVVGAGFGGLGCAHALSQLRGGVGDEVHVTVVDAKDWFTIGGTWQYVWSSRVQQSDAKWNLSENQIEGVNFRLNTTVSKLVLDEKYLLINDEKVPFDHLVLSPGVVGDADSIPGLSTSLDMYNFDSVKVQEEQLKEIAQRAAAGEKMTLHIPIGKTPYKCPVAPFEAAFIADDVLCKANCRENVRIVVSSPVEWPLPDPARPVFERLMQEKKIELIAANGITKLEGNIATLADGQILEATHTWSVYPQTSPQFIHEAGLTNAKGFVPVDITTNRVQGHDSVYVIGDCCGIMVGGKPHPKAGEFAWVRSSLLCYEKSFLVVCI